MGNPFGRSNVLPLTNNSGGSVAAGDLVYLDTAHDDSFTTGTTSAYTGAIGIAQQAIGAGSVGLVLVSGYASLVNVNASVTRGHYGASFTAAKQATDAGASRAAGTCMVFLKGGTTPDAQVWQPDLGGGSGMANPMSATGDTIYSSSGSTPAALAVGGVGKSLSGGTTPSWAYAPLIGFHAYTPGTDVAIGNNNTSTLTALDATNAAVTFTAPGSGNVWVSVDCLMNLANGSCYFGLLEGAGQVGNLQYMGGFPAGTLRDRVSFYLTGVSAGSHTYKVAGKNTSSGNTGLYGGPTFGDLIIAVVACP